MKILEQVKQRTYHPLKGLATALGAVVAYLLVLVVVTAVVNFVMS